VRALLSVANRQGLAALARDLLALGVELYATDGTREHLAADGVEVRPVAALTNVPPLLGGTVKKMPIFKGANLSGVKMIADLPGADLSGADFSRAMVGVNIKNQGMGQMRTDLSNANLAGATLAGADFNRSLMAFCNLKGSNLRGANFFRVKFGGADLTGADVTGADFTEADVSGTVFRDVKGFAEAKGLDRAENVDKIVR